MSICEEYHEALKVNDGDADYAVIPMFHGFHIPEEARWEGIRNTSKNIGQAIQTALRAIEDHNERLHGVFGDAQWTNKERLPKPAAWPPATPPYCPPEWCRRRG